MRNGEVCFAFQARIRKREKYPRQRTSCEVTAFDKDTERLRDGINSLLSKESTDGRNNEKAQSKDTDICSNDTREEYFFRLRLSECTLPVG